MRINPLTPPKPPPPHNFPIVSSAFSSCSQIHAKFVVNETGHYRTCSLVSICIKREFSWSTGCLKTYVTNFPGYSPSPSKQKMFLSTWVQKWTGSKISTYINVPVPFWLLHEMFKVLTIYRNTSVERSHHGVPDAFQWTWSFSDGIKRSKCSTSSYCLWCRFLFIWHCLRTYSLDTSYCIPFRTLSITHRTVFLVNHGISRISTHQLISPNLFHFGPMWIGIFLLNWGVGNTQEKLVTLVLKHPYNSVYAPWILFLSDQQNINKNADSLTC